MFIHTFWLRPGKYGRLKYKRHDAQNVSNKILLKMHEVTVVTVDFSKLFSLDNFILFNTFHIKRTSLDWPSDDSFHLMPHCLLML